MNSIIRVLIILIIYGGLQFFLGCQYSLMFNSAQAVDNTSESWYNIKDPNLDYYYDRDNN